MARPQIRWDGTLETGSVEFTKEMHVRNATTTDAQSILDISASATRKFAAIPDLSDLAYDRESEETVHKWLTEGKTFLVERAEDSLPVGFVAVFVKTSSLYIAEISVLEACQGKGVGGLLIDVVKQWAVARGARVSLTTYADVSWNGPWYRKRGFVEVDQTSVDEWHVEKMAKDKTDLERPGYRRCCMVWDADLSELNRPAE